MDGDEEFDPIIPTAPLPHNFMETTEEGNEDDDKNEDGEDDKEEESDEEIIRQKLQWYFKTPFEKYKERGRKPYKFLLQIIKIIVITAQATLFAVDEFSLVQFNNNNLNMFRSTFIPQYAGTPVKKLYSRDMVYEHIMYAWKNYYNFDQTSTGPYKATKNKFGEIKLIRFCKTWNNVVRNLVGSIHLSGDGELAPTECHDLKSFNRSHGTSSPYQFAVDNQLPLQLGWILSMSLTYSFQMSYSRDKTPDCYHFNVEVYFDNQDLDGIMTVTLNSKVDYRSCPKSSNRIPPLVELDSFRAWQSLLDAFLMVLCFISTCLCVRSFRNHYIVYQQTKMFFYVHRGEVLQFSDAVVFVSFWMIMMVVSDVCAFAGSALKIVIDLFERPDLYTSCSSLFGVAVLFAWIGVLRNLGYIQGYNTLLVTLKVSLPSTIRFTCCVSFIYFGFTICGWIVFGPYHPKFSSILAASECLFSLLNGDDMWPTFNTMRDIQQVCPFIYYFSKVYLFVFISLFIFVVLSLFIGIVGDTYEKIKDQGSAPKTRLQVFMEGGDYVEAFGEREGLLESTCTCFYKGNVRVRYS